MDITKSSDKVKTNQYLNGETVNYTAGFLAVSFLFLIVKQLLKITVGLSAPLSVGIAAVIGAVVLFFYEKRFVFHRSQRGGTARQALRYLFRCAVDFGFYKIASFAFVTILKVGDAFAFLMTFFIYLFFNYYFDRLIVFDCVKKAEENRNGRLLRAFYENRFVVFSAAMTFVILGFFYMIYSAFPFGDTTILRMDLYHQYGPLFCELYDKVTDGGSFFYSWISGGGSSFLGNYFNYLSSPLSFIVLLFDRKEMPLAITTLVAVKGALCAVGFTLYLKHSQKRHSFAAASFGVLYAMSAYFLAYYWNIMWIDGMFLFPIILLGIERIINEGKPLCYIATLTVLFWATYYMAYMVCLFSVVYFIGYYLMRYDLFDKLDGNKHFEKRYDFGKLTNSRLMRSGLIFAGGSLLAAMLCAISLLPVFLILQNSSATSDDFPGSFNLYYDILNLITSHLASLETTIRSSGDDVLPNVYCGILTLVLLPLYAVNKKISVREKVVYFAILIFFLFSFNNNMANFIWHAFHFPNDLPFRFSFMYSFFLLVIAFRTLMNFKGLEYRDIVTSGIFWTLIVIILQKYMTNKMNNVTIYLSLGLILLWTAFLLLLNNESLRRPILSAMLVFFVFCEVGISDISSIHIIQCYAHYTQNYDTYREAIKETTDKDKSLYRMELSKLDTRMDACLYGYRGISTFSSMAYETYSGNQYSLGMYGNRINSYTYNTQTPVYNMFYGIKYVLKVEDSLAPSADYYEKTYTTKNEKCEVYKNKYALPFAFTTAEDIGKLEFEEGNPFKLQEALIDGACGASNIFVPVKYRDTDFDSVDCETVEDNGVYYFSKTSEDSSFGTVDITLETVNDSNLYVYITSPKLENVNYYWGKDEEKTAYQNINTSYIMDLGKHRKGEQVRVSLDIGSMEGDSSYFEIYAYNIDYDKFVAAYDLLKLGAMEVTSYSDTCIKGTVNAGYNGTLYTSIPYDKGWSIYIDGKKQKTTEAVNAQLGCAITKGEHSVELKYAPQGFSYGAAATGAAWAGVAVWALLRLRKKRKAKIVENV